MAVVVEVAAEKKRRHGKEEAGLLEITDVAVPSSRAQIALRDVMIALGSRSNLWPNNEGGGWR